MAHSTHSSPGVSPLSGCHWQRRAFRLLVSLVTLGVITVSAARAAPVTVTAGLLGGPGFRIGGIASLEIDVEPAQSQLCFTAGVRAGGITRVSLLSSASASGGGDPLLLPIQQIIRSGAGELATGCTSISSLFAGGVLLSAGSYAIQVDFQQGSARGDLHLP